jgi:hypothetical protein
MSKIETGLMYFMALTLSVGVLAHEVEYDEHVELIPIPAFDHFNCDASGTSALLALQKLLDALPEESRNQMTFELDSLERYQWSNLPARMDPRSGINLDVLSDEQRALLFEFLASALGQQGYETVAGVMAAEAFLADDSKAERFRWAPEYYWLSIYGEPSNSSEWAWAFGGHHLAINMTLDQGRVISMSPHFVGTEPARFTLDGIDYDLLTDMHEAGFKIYQSLDAGQKEFATLTRAPREVLGGSGKDGVVPPIEGISVAQMTGDQQRLVMEAVHIWVSHQPAENSVPSMEEIASDLSETYFAWFGEFDITSPSYFRIQGPSVIVELLGGMRSVGSSAQNLGHYHTVYRDPTNDYGAGH